MKNPEIRKVVWHDARGGCTNWTLYNPDDYVPASVTTIGQVFKETKDYIVLLSSFYEDEPGVVHHHNGVLILKKSIVEQNTLT